MQEKKLSVKFRIGQKLTLTKITRVVGTRQASFYMPGIQTIWALFGILFVAGNLVN
jgi:hypothetical protein